MPDEGAEVIIHEGKYCRIVSQGGIYDVKTQGGDSTTKEVGWVSASELTRLVALEAYEAGREHAGRDADMHRRDGQLELGGPCDTDPAPLQDIDVVSSDELDKTKEYELAPGELDT